MTIEPKTGFVRGGGGGDGGGHDHAHDHTGARTSTAFAPAKINLTLRVTGRRGDGYHLLSSVVTFADVGDVVRVSPRKTEGSKDVLKDEQYRGALTYGLPASSSGGVPGFEVEGPFAAALRGALAPGVLASPVLAAQKLAARIGASASDVDIVLEKHLPVASGMGGGTSDAMATLRALRDFWSVELSPEAWLDLALEIGADGPACFLAEPLMMEGIGETVTTLRAWPALHAILVNPGVSSPTPAIFATYKASARAFSQSSPHPTAHSVDEAFSYLRGEANDLTDAAQAQCPHITDVMDMVACLPGVSLVRMTGSGATLVALCADQCAVQQNCAVVARAFPEAWVVPACLGGTPARG